MLRDLSQAARGLWRAPGVFVSSALVLGCGIGAATAVFTVLSAVLLRPLPYAHPGELVVLLHGGQAPVSPADYLDYRRDSRSYSSMSAAQYATMTLAGAGDPARVDGLAVSAGLFDTLGVPAAIGRTFSPGEDALGRDHVVVLSHGLWVERFAADATIVGRAITLDGERWTVVGVMPEGFSFAPFWATGARFWRPLPLAARLDDRGGRSLRVFARLAPGVTVDAAQAEASTIAARLADAYPDTNQGLGITVVPLLDKTTSPIRPTLVALASMVGLVLLMAVANVATLLLVRGSSRQKELALRAALGAGYGRIVRQLVTESLIVGLAATAVGLVLGAWSVTALVAMIPERSLPRQSEIVLDPLVFALAASVGLVAAVLAGLVPALQLARAEPQESLRDGGRTATEHGRGRTIRRVLVGVELALAMVLVAGAALMGRTLLALQGVDPGFDPGGVVALTVAVDGFPEAAPERRAAYFDTVAAALAAVPGITRVGAINHLPLAGDTWRFHFEVEGKPLRPADRPSATWRVVAPGYFETMRLRVRGRSFDGRDASAALPVAIVNETMAARHWPGTSPLGKRLRVGLEGDVRWLTVVGVSTDARQDEWAGPVAEELYVPYAQHAGEFGGTELTFVVRAAGDPATAGASAVRAVWSVDPDVPIARVTTMEKVVADRMWRARVTAALVSGFALAALLLAAVGVYTVTSYVMARRTREIGIRMALGATSGHVARLAARESALPIGTGLVAGGALGLGMARVLGALLYGVPPGDAWSFGGAALLLVTVGGVAGWWPARRASRIAPVEALREE